MNQYQRDLFNGLEALVASGDAFYRQEFVLDGSVYWIYNYRLASYSDFQQPAGRECRGHMFEVDALGAPIRLASLPMQKFHNLYECPLTMNLDLSKVDTVELKADGSIMSTFVHTNGSLRLKSKGSLFSEQAVDAQKWLVSEPRFAQALQRFDQAGYTVNMEWCAPFNRIVIGYAHPHLKVLNARIRDTGAYSSRETLIDHFGQDNVIEAVDLAGLDITAFVQSIPAMTDDIEGYVARIDDLWFKVKTEKYMSLHHAKDSVNNPRRLFEAIVDEGIDDLRSLFATDTVALAIIDAMQTKVNGLYNTMVRQVEVFFHGHDQLDRKSYALAAKASPDLDQRYFGLVMNKYVGRNVEYKEFMKSKYKEFGIKDTVAEKE